MTITWSRFLAINKIQVPVLQQYKALIAVIAMLLTSIPANTQAQSIELIFDEYKKEAKERTKKAEKLVGPQEIDQDDKVPDAFSRLRSYEGTHAYFDYGRGNSLDGHLDVQYSLKYLFTKPRSLEEVIEEGTDWEVSFTFSGEFDFYAGTRNSGPVIGRRYNPGLMFQRIYTENDGLVAYSLGVEHESNGQSTDTISVLNALTNDFREIYSSELPDILESYYLEMATDTISRSTEAFVAASTTFRYNPNNTSWLHCDMDISCFEFQIKMRKSFLDVEDRVFWDPEMRNARLLEHQGTQLTIYTAFDDGNKFLSLVYRTGELFGGKPGSKNTFDVSYFHDLPLGSKFRLPLIVSYHYGYLEELSLYSYKSSYFSLGLYFSI